MDWTQVILAAIGATVAIANGLGIALIFRHIQTPSRATIGRQIESVHHVALGNNYRIQALTKGLDVNVPPDAAMEEAHRDPPGEPRGVGP